MPFAARPALAALIAVAWLPGPFAPTARAQQPAPGGDVEERAVVVVRDVFVEGKLGAPERLSITLDGKDAPVVAVAESDDEPLHTLIVLDGHLVDTTELRRAAVLTAGLAGALTALGPVRVVVMRSNGAEERIDWTTNGERVERSLSQLGIDGTSEAALSELRLPWTAADALDEEPPSASEAERAAREATLTVIRHVDRLIELAAEPQRSSRRLLLLAGGGWDPCPGAFFGVAEIAPSATGCDAGKEPSPGGRLGPTLATLGWTVVAILPPDPEDAKAWRFGMLDRVGQADQTSAADPGAGGPALFGVTIKINQERKPKRARAYLEEGRAHLARGELDAAEEDGRKAIHHFADGRKTRAEEADAWRLVAAVHARRGEASDTARTLVRAQRLAPRGGRATPAASASERLARAYREARRPLERLAADTAGAAVYESQQVQKAVTEIAARARVTYQFPEAVAADLQRLEVRADGRLLEAAPWTSPSPSALTSLAAARKLLRGARSGRRPAFEVFVPEDAAGPGGTLTLSLELSGVLPEVRRWSEGPWRVTVLHSELDAEQHHVDAPVREPGGDRFTLELDLDRRTPISLILVEDLATGVWGYRAR